MKACNQHSPRANDEAETALGIRATKAFTGCRDQARPLGAEDGGISVRLGVWKLPEAALYRARGG